MPGGTNTMIGALKLDLAAARRVPHDPHSLQNTPAGISDSGYLSHATEEPYSINGRDSRGPVYLDHATLSEQAISHFLLFPSEARLTKKSIPILYWLRSGTFPKYTLDT